MCDCYSAKCEFCDSMVETHIADFCVPREAIAVVCHECVENGRKVEKDGWYLIDESTIEEPRQVWCENFGDTFDLGTPGKVVRFYSYDPRAYGVHLN